MNQTTLTRERLLAHAKPSAAQRVELQDLGTVWIRPRNEVLRIRRIVQYQSSNGTSTTDRKSYYRVDMMIDQLVDEAGEPIFQESDRRELAELDGRKLDPVIAAIEEYNGDDEKKEPGGSTDT